MDEGTLKTVRQLTPEASDFGDEVLGELFDLSDHVEAIQRRIRELAERTGMPSLHFFLLEQVALSGGAAPLSELLRVLNVPKQSATYLVDTLEKQGLVERRRDSRDRRRYEIALTPRGNERVVNNLGAFYSAMLRALETVPREDRVVLVRGLRAFREALDEPS